MTFHAITEYIKHLITAKGRHGTHSPFVYAFVEDVVQGKKRSPRSFDWPVTRYTQILDNMCAYYDYSNIAYLKDSLNKNNRYDVLLLQAEDVSQWKAQLKTALQHLNNDGVIVVPTIHKNREFSEAWCQLHTLPEVKLSLDLYGPGLLFFKKDFKEKQHFVLKRD